MGSEFHQGFSVLGTTEGSGQMQTDASQRDSRLRRIMIAASGLLGLLFLLSLVVPIGTAVIASGAVGSESQIKRIAHPTGGVIAAIAVANGESVGKGDLLLRLEDRVSGATETYSTMTVEQLLAQRARLEAERLGAQKIVFPSELEKGDGAGVAKAMADETKLFALRREEESQLRAQLLARIAQHSQQIVGYKAQISSLETQRELIGPELSGVRQLYEQELVTINRLNELERSNAALGGSIAALYSDTARTRAAITEARERMVQLGQSRRAEAATELARINTILNDQQTRNVSASDEQVKTEILAPYAGTVERLAYTSIGDVIRPAEPILEIVPEDGLNTVEAMVSPVDVDRVAEGQAARVRFVAFNMATTPEIEGVVTYVATDRTDVPETGESYFKARIRLDQESLERLQFDLRSGMPAEVYIKTGSRSLISFLLKPLGDQMARAFRYD